MTYGEVEEEGSGRMFAVLAHYGSTHKHPRLHTPVFIELLWVSLRCDVSLCPAHCDSHTNRLCP